MSTNRSRYAVFMYSAITQLGQRGSRHPSREISDDEGVLGPVTLDGSVSHLSIQLP